MNTRNVIKVALLVLFIWLNIKQEKEYDNHDYEVLSLGGREDGSAINRKEKSRKRDCLLKVVWREVIIN